MRSRQWSIVREPWTRPVRGKVRRCSADAERNPHRARWRRRRHIRRPHRPHTGAVEDRVRSTSIVLRGYEESAKRERTREESKTARSLLHYVVRRDADPSGSLKEGSGERAQ